MATVGSTAQTRASGHSVATTLLKVALGTIVGIVLIYLAAVVATAPSAGNYIVNPITLTLIALLGAVGVAVGWRWPLIGLSAGVSMVLLVAFAVISHIAWISSSAAWLDPFNAIAYAAASGYPVLIGAVLITVSSLRTRAARH